MKNNNKTSRINPDIHKLSMTKPKQITATVINNQSVAAPSISPFEKSNEVHVDQPSSFDIQNYHSRRSFNTSNKSPVPKSLTPSITNSKLPPKQKNADMGEVDSKDLNAKHRNYLRNYESAYSFQKG